MTTTRRYDLDWLRVLAFGLLILYHVGMFYVADWDWHIKSQAPSETLQYAMYLTNPWRMSLLFFVSGAALFFACRKIRGGELFRLRNKRLLLPLLFSMAVIVPPQVYVELTSKEGMAAGYLEFYLTYLNAATDQYPDHQHGPLGLWTWNHLWFLAYLWVYTLVFLVVKPLLDSSATWLSSRKAGAKVVLLLPVLLLVFFRITLADNHPPTNALFDDWYNHARYLSFLFGGYVIAGSNNFWDLVKSYRRTWLVGALVAYALVLTAASELMQNVLSFLDETWVTLIIRIVVSLDQWLWILAALGWAGHYLNRPSRVLSYMNEAILPWYIFHQTLIVLLAFWLMPLSLWQPLEVLLITAGTIAGCAIGYEVVRRFAVGRLLFGLKSDGVHSNTTGSDTAVLKSSTVARLSS